jgi:pyridoxal 5'-phosphate synthase pdxT subunit
MAKLGILALQGAFREHAEALQSLDADVSLVKRPEHLAGIDGLVLPGGESTTIDKLLDWSGLREPLAEHLQGGLPAFATCAGLIVLATEVLDGRPDQVPLAQLDVTVRRNGYGRQRESFEAELAVREVPGGNFRGVFIRAPKVERSGAAVTILAEHEGVPVFGRQGSVYFSSFHPELSGDLRLHELFLHEVR